MNSPKCMIVLINLQGKKNSLAFRTLAFTSKLCRIQFDLFSVSWADSSEAGTEHIRV